LTVISEVTKKYFKKNQKLFGDLKKIFSSLQRKTKFKTNKMLRFNYQISVKKSGLCPFSIGAFCAVA